MNSEQAPAVSPRPGRPSLDFRVAAMRRSGMSATAIRRALGLSRAQAVAAGIVAPSMSTAGDRPPVRTDQTDLAHRAVASVAPSGPHMAEVLAAVARAADLRPEDVLSPDQDRRTARPRQLVMYMLRTLCAGASLPAIGHFLDRDHTTVLYGCRRAEALLKHDSAFQALHARARGALTDGDGEAQV